MDGERQACSSIELFLQESPAEHFHSADASEFLSYRFQFGFPEDKLMVSIGGPVPISLQVGRYDSRTAPFEESTGAAAATGLIQNLAHLPIDIAISFSRFE
ncbi:MAG: hypothetical protein IVW54_10500 [Candidatus Binataceae bacterium]|nr:hypothetical protein [Candidatus Binataceae bacterium]